MKFIFLTKEFYNKYSTCNEIEKKDSRPYVQVAVRIDGILFAIPMRSHIQHPYVLWTDRESGCGLDFSKAVVIIDEIEEISDKVPYIRPIEFDSLRGKEFLIATNLRKYISEYKEAKMKQNIPRNRIMCQYSTLQYFEEYI